MSRSTLVTHISPKQFIHNAFMILATLAAIAFLLYTAIHVPQSQNWLITTYLPRIYEKHASGACDTTVPPSSTVDTVNPACYLDTALFDRLLKLLGVRNASTRKTMFQVLDTNGDSKVGWGEIAGVVVVGAGNSGDGQYYTRLFYILEAWRKTGTVKDIPITE